MIRAHQNVNVLVDNAHFSFFFHSYFCTALVLRFFEYFPKFSFEIKLDCTHLNSLLL